MFINPTTLSNSFKTIASDILSASESNLYSIECSIMLSKNQIVNIPPYNINQLTISQNFFSDHRDISVVDLELPLETYKLITKNRQNLVFMIKLYDMDMSGTISKQPFDTRYYKGILRNPEDPNLYMPESTIQNTESEQDKIGIKTLNISVELIPSIIYKIRKSKINFILNDATMEDTILLISHILGFKNVFISPPDNITKYKNIIIPPLLDISNIFNFLQEHNGYGIYNASINYYISDEILYVVPMFAYINGGFLCTIYNSGDGTYSGSNNYHRIKNNELSILNSNKIEVVQPSQSNIENIGNSFIVNNSLRFKEGSGELISNGNFIIDHDLLTSVSIYDNDSGVDKDSFTQQYIVADNIYNILSSLNINTIFHVGMVWPHARPFILKPNTNISFVINNEDTFVKYTGWINSIQYTLVRTKTISKETFACKANMSLRLLNNI